MSQLEFDEVRAWPAMPVDHPETTLQSILATLKSIDGRLERLEAPPMGIADPTHGLPMYPVSPHFL